MVCGERRELVRVIEFPQAEKERRLLPALGLNLPSVTPYKERLFFPSLSRVQQKSRHINWIPLCLQPR